MLVFDRNELEIRRVSSLVHDDHLPSSPVLVIYGTEATGKTTIVSAIFKEFDLSFSWVTCNECVTNRHLLEKIAGVCADGLAERMGQEEAAASLPPTVRQDNVSTLYVQMQKLAQFHTGKHFVILDGIDRYREVSPLLLSGLARLGEIPSLSIVMIVTTPRTRFLSMPEPPYIHFPAYTKEEAVAILALKPRSIFNQDPNESEEEYTEEMAEEDLWLWTQCCNATWDTLGKYTARNLIELRDAADEMWIPLIQPILDQELGIRDFSRLFNRLKNEKLKNKEESFVSSSVVKRTNEGAIAANMNKTSDLPYFSKYLLCAAYLASYTSPKLDMKFFSKGAEGSKRARRGGTRKQAKSRQLNRNHLGPRAFAMERMIAIFHAILPFRMAGSADLGCQIATLLSLRLIIKTSAGASVLDAGGKWKVNIGFDYARALGRIVKLDIESHMDENVV